MIEGPFRRPPACFNVLAFFPDGVGPLLFRVVHRYVGNLSAMPGVFPAIQRRWFATPTLAPR